MDEPASREWTPAESVTFQKMRSRRRVRTRLPPSPQLEIREVYLFTWLLVALVFNRPEPRCMRTPNSLVTEPSNRSGTYLLVDLYGSLLRDMWLPNVIGNSAVASATKYSRRKHAQETEFGEALRVHLAWFPATAPHGAGLESADHRLPGAGCSSEPSLGAQRFPPRRGSSATRKL